MKDPKRVLEILGRLKREFPAARTALAYSTPFELVVATILSAQTTDAQVNKVTDSLFKKYRVIEDYARAKLPALKRDLASVNFYNRKAANIQACARLLVAKHGGRVPRTMTELVELPGVARKTANIVLSTLYGVNEGIAVDTHVKRLAFRLGLTRRTDPVKVEIDLMAQTPQAEWANLSNLLIFHGRKTCRALRPLHDRCVLSDVCPSRNIKA
jgi:endonuclease-3